MSTYFPPIGASSNRYKPQFGYGPFSSYTMPAGYPNYLQAFHPAFAASNPNNSNAIQQMPPCHYGAATDASVSSIPEMPEVSGGITSVMEYEPATMASFLSWCALGMLKQGRKATADFEQAIVSILHATRLPKSTIVVALEYINQRFGESASRVLSDGEVFTNVVISLVLANKFNDDNTFTNSSWSGATGLPTKDINKEEVAWLKAVNWDLNVVPFRANIDCLEECWTTWLSRYSPKTAIGNASPYSPISSYTPNYTHAYPPLYTSSSPLYADLTSQNSVATSPVSSSTQNYNFSGYEWQKPVTWGYGLPTRYLQPLIWAHKPSASQYSSDFASYGYGFPNTYYNCMASC